MIFCSDWKTGQGMVKFPTFLKYFRGWTYLRKKVEKLSIIVEKIKCRRKASKSWYEVQQGVFSPPSQTVLPFSTLARVVFEIKRRIVSEKKAETKWKKLMFERDLIMD
jgi:hypothetical protein